MNFNTIEEKLEALDQCGLRLGPQFGVTDLVASWGRKALDVPGFDLALVCLGMTQEKPPWMPHCDKLWHFDTECIEDDESYVRIAKRLAEMAQGSLPLSGYQGRVDHDTGKAWLRFQCQGKPMQIDCAVDNDWVDTDFFAHFTALLAKFDPNKIFLYYDLGGQDCIIGCVTLDEYEKLKKLIPSIGPLT